MDTNGAPVVCAQSHELQSRTALLAGQERATRPFTLAGIPRRGQGLPGSREQSRAWIDPNSSITNGAVNVTAQQGLEPI